MHFGMWQLRPEFQSQIRATDDWPSMAAFKGHLFQRVAAISRKWKEIGRFFFSLLRDFLSWALQKFRQNWNRTTQLRWILFERWVPRTSLRGPVIWLKFAVLKPRFYRTLTFLALVNLKFEEKDQIFYTGSPDDITILNRMSPWLNISNIGPLPQLFAWYWRWHVNDIGTYSIITLCSWRTWWWPTPPPPT